MYIVTFLLQLFLFLIGYYPIQIFSFFESVVET